MSTPGHPEGHTRPAHHEAPALSAAGEPAAGTDAAAPPVALLLTDLVDSAAIAQRLGDDAMARIWAAHDRVARDLLRSWRGREIDKTDGFLLMFAQATDALGYVLAYHRALAAVEAAHQPADGRPLRLRARAGLHVGAVTVRETPAADVALGAKPIEVDGVTKPLAARVMSTALGGQTLITAAARHALGAVAQRVVSHGHWRVKGIPVPVELLEVGDDDAPFTPPPDAEKVYRVVLQGELWLPVRETRHSLPAQRDSFVGRRGTLQELAHRFDTGARLVSLLGIGGCGKTRLAVHFGWQWLGDFPGGAWFCDLAPARSAEGILSSVAQGLDIPLAAEDPLAQIGHAIAARGRCLVILDNFEQVARHAEDTLGRWLARAPESRFLVTTREVLGMVGEEALALAPLPADDAQRLFIKRAGAAQRGFAPGPADQEAIGPLVRLLDGLPLAIELAAARVRTLPPRALLARMSERFKLLASSGSRLDRQSTLRAAFDWSWDLLQPGDKAALAQLSVFEGGFTLEAAEAIIDLSTLPDAPWTVDAINSLVDKSFVRPLQGERFDLLMSVQAYAAEHLATEGRYPGSGPVARAAAHQRHGAWFAALGPARAAEGACADLDNLAVACRRAVAAGHPQLAADALVGAWTALNLRGPFQAAEDLAEAVCAMPGLAGCAAAHAHRVLGAALEALGQRARALPQFEQALAQARDAGDPACEAAVLVRLAGLYRRDGLVDRARASLDRALQLAQAGHDGEHVCAALNGLGMLEFEPGRLDAARVHYDQALAHARAIGDRRWQGLLLNNLANLEGSQGRLKACGARSEEALAMAQALGDRRLEGERLANLGMLSFLLEQWDASQAHSLAALAAARELGHARLEWGVLTNLGLLAVTQGRPTEAVAHLEQALALARGLGNRRGEGQTLASLGAALAQLGRFEEARACLDDGRAILDSLQDHASLALLWCGMAECEALAGEGAAAGRAYAHAQSLAVQTRDGGPSEVSLALARVAPLVEQAARTAATRAA